MAFIRSHPVFTVFLLIIAGTAAFTAYTLTSRQAARGGGWNTGETLVTALPATRQIMIDSIESVGTAVANESVTLTAKVTDTVSQVHFEDGMWVNEGDILVELTNSEETAQLAEARATVDEATRQYRRVENLIRQKLASETQLDTEKVRMDTAQARLEAIVARLDDRLIRAPFSGVLGFRNISPGSLLTPTTIVTTIDDIDVIKLDFSLPEKYLSQITAGQRVETRSPAYPGRDFEGKVQTLGSRVDPVTRSINVRALLDNRERLLKPGMLLNVTLTIDQVETLVVPEAAIIPIQDRAYVYRIDDSNQAQRIEVSTGRRARGKVEVLSGLDTGDLVVTEGIIKLSPGQQVRLKEVDAEA